MNKQTDVLGTALLDYWEGDTATRLVTWTSLTDEEDLDVGYFFRAFSQMPELEQKALQLAKGRILDVGCGPGSHSLYLQAQGKNVTALDYSAKAVKVTQKRGVKQTVHADFFDFDAPAYDTILMLMNGAGVAQTLDGLPGLFSKLEQHLTPRGQVLIDSSDLQYLFEDDLGLLPQNNYYGEVTFGTRYKGNTEEFPWLYIDEKLLTQCATQMGWRCELLLKGPHWDYLARLTREY